MQMKGRVVAGLKNSVTKGDVDSCKAYAEKAIVLEIDAYEAIMTGCAEGMRVVGEKYQRREYFIPELLLSAEAMNAAMDILRPYVKETSDESVAPKVVLGVVEGDIHDIGKKIVRIIFEANRFKVFDLGKNVPLEMFVNKAKETGADVIGLSTFITTTLPMTKLLIDQLKKEGIRGKVKVILGGAAASRIFAEKIGADAYAEDAIEGVKKIKNLLKGR
jgi:dimethylamine corrinoid protein